MDNKSSNWVFYKHSKNSPFLHLWKTGPNQQQGQVAQKSHQFFTQLPSKLFVKYKGFERSYKKKKKKSNLALATCFRNTLVLNHLLNIQRKKSTIKQLFTMNIIFMHTVEIQDINRNKVL